MGRVRRLLPRVGSGVAVAVLALAVSLAGGAAADPASDALARLDELSRQAVQTREAVTQAQRDAEDKAAAQAQAEDRHRADVAALDAANAQLASRQAAADKVAAMTYVSGRTGQWAALLSAGSPQQLIDQLSIQRAVTTETTAQMKAFQSARKSAATAAEASEKSAAEARTAAEQSTALRADLQKKFRELQKQIAAAEAQYASLTPGQRAVVDNAAAAPPPPEAPAPPPQGPPAPAAPPILAMPGQPPGEVVPPPAAALMAVPEALPPGVASEAGLQLNTVLAARAISARFPQISDIDGVRPDSKPWHPSGLAIDVMIPNPESPEGIALGDEIKAFMLSNASRFGLQDVIWRGTYYTPDGPAGSGYGHYDHVHVTTTPRR